MQMQQRGIYSAFWGAVERAQNDKIKTNKD